MSYIEDMFGLSDKIVILTGGGGAIAGSMAESLLKSGAKIALWDIKKEFLDASKERLIASTGKGANIYCVEVDNMNEESTKKAVEETEKNLGIPNTLINTAGGNRGKCNFSDVKIEEFEFVLKLNLIAGLVVPTKIITSYWINKNIKGAIINMNSMGSYIPLSGVWAYDAAKAGVNNLTMATAKEFAPYGIRINAIAPGFFIGKQNKELLIKNDETGELTERGASVISRTPYGRFGDASELNGAMIYLLSEKASGFVTGISIPVDGGFLVDNI